MDTTDYILEESVKTDLEEWYDIVKDDLSYYEEHDLAMDSYIYENLL